MFVIRLAKFALLVSPIIISETLTVSKAHVKIKFKEMIFILIPINAFWDKKECGAFLTSLASLCPRMDYK